MSNLYLPLETGKFYHIYNRGIDGTPIFKDKENYKYFLTLYDKYCSWVVDTYCYCLLGNHFHFLVSVKEVLPTYRDLYADLPPEQLTSKAYQTVSPSTQFAHFFNAYAQSFNRSFQKKRTGGLFEEPFRRKLVENETYFSALVQYIHQNPQKHGFVEDFRNYEYSSYWSHVSTKNTKLKRKEVLQWFGDGNAYQKFHEVACEVESIKDYIIEVDD